MKRIILLFAITAISYALIGQKTEHLQNVNSTRSKAVFLGKTEPLKNLIPREATDQQKRSYYKKNRQVPNFFGRGNSKAIYPELEHQGPDPLRQTGFEKGRSVSVDPLVNIEGLDFGGRPSDPTGDVGQNYYIQAVNSTTIALYDKSDGSQVSSFTGNTLWNSLGESSAGDPIILYDHEESRWIITEFTSPNGSASLLFAISETSDPLGSYYTYLFTPPNFPDYPKWAIWGDVYFVTTNEEGPGSLHQYFFDRAALLNGDEEITFERVEIEGNFSTEAGFYVSTPVHWIGDTAPVDGNMPMAVKINDSSWGEVEEDVIEVFTFDIDLENGTTVTKTSIVTTPFDSYPCDTETGGFACLAQGNASTGVDAIPEVIMNLPHYRNFGTHESIVLSFITDVTDGENLSGIRWVELRRTSGDWELYQEGTYAPDDGLHRFMPSISMDDNGNIALAYNTTSSEESIGVRYTGRFATDDLGTMTVLETTVVSGDNDGFVPGDRFGDYAQMAIDPVDERTFWYTTEYTDDNGVTSRIVSFKIERNDNDLAAISIDSPVTSDGLTATETVTATVQNVGKNTYTAFDITLFLDDSEVETFSYTGSLATDETYQHSFSTTVDLSMIGDYDIRVEVVGVDDEVEENNTISGTVSQIYSYDLGVTMELDAETCKTGFEVEIEIENFGAETITALDIELFVAEELLETINWTGSLIFGESATEQITFTGLEEGINDVSVNLTNLNGENDQNLTNNEAAGTIDFDGSLESITLVINTDLFPEETTWELYDSESNLVFSGGPYPGLQQQEIVEELCIETETCYEFVMLDAFGDGICCEWGNGSYEILDSTEETIFASDGQFVSSESTNFCTGEGCFLEVEVDVVNETFELPGSIIFGASGSFDYEYSIDGGTTFQESEVFDGLVSGMYETVVSSQDGECLFEETIDLLFDCSLEFIVELSNINQDLGNVTIIATGGNDIEYSIDAGVTFQASNLFENVPAGTYDISVRSDDELCLITESVTIDYILGIDDNSEQIKVYPNPTDGVFKLRVPGKSYIDGLLHVQVIDINGKIIQTSKFSRYDGVFEGMISLYAYPNGVYFVKLVDSKDNKIIKIIKE